MDCKVETAFSTLLCENRYTKWRSARRFKFFNSNCRRASKFNDCQTEQCTEVPLVATRSAKWIIYLIAVNAVLLTLFVLIAIMMEGQTGDRSGLYFLPICLGIGTGQACLLGAYLACANVPFGIRLRWFARLVMVQWCCFVIPLVPNYSPKQLHWQFPWCVLIDQLLVAIAAFVTLWILRLVSGRGVSMIDEAATIKTRSNVRILDLLIWISLVAVFLSSALRFKGEPMGFEGIIYAVMVLGGLFVGSPIGAILPFFLVGYLAEGRKAMALTAVVSCFALLVGLGPFLFYTDSESRIGTLLFASCGLGLVIANTFAFRFLCYRFQKLPRSQESESTNQVTTNNVAEESPNA